MILYFQTEHIKLGVFENWKLLSPVTRELCPVRELMDRLGDKWSILILHCLERGPKRFNAMRREIEGISQRVLTVNLRSLERDGFVTRNAMHAKILHVDYALTPMGVDLIGLTAGLVHWAMSHEHQIETSRAVFDEALGEFDF